MTKKKPIKCYKELSGCGATCVEVGKAIGYPKEEQDVGVIEAGIEAYEYRYVCPECGKEFLHETLYDYITEIKEPDFQIKLENGKELYSTNNKHLIEHFGFEAGKKYTGKEVRKLFLISND